MGLRSHQRRDRRRRAWRRKQQEPHIRNSVRIRTAFEDWLQRNHYLETSLKLELIDNLREAR